MTLQNKLNAFNRVSGQLPRMRLQLSAVGEHSEPTVYCNDVIKPRPVATLLKTLSPLARLGMFFKLSVGSLWLTHGWWL